MHWATRKARKACGLQCEEETQCWAESKPRRTTQRGVGGQQSARGHGQARLRARDTTKRKKKHRCEDVVHPMLRWHRNPVEGRAGVETGSRPIQGS